MEEQYKRYQQIIKKITKNDEKTEDLLHDVLIQLSQNKVYNTLTIKEQTYFFIRAAKNQFYSNNSLFQRTYNRYQYQEFNNILEVPDEPYEEKPTMEWVNETLEEELKNNQDFWYNYGIFKLYLEHKKIETLHKKTSIPRYSLRNTLKEVKLLINKKWLEQNGEN
jgi:hypothetical protein